MAILKQDLSFLKNNVKQVDAEMFTSKIRGIMDNHAPQTSRTVTDRTSSPWFSVESKAAKQARRRVERKWNKSGLEIDKQIYLYHKKQVRGINLTAKREYYNLRFSEVQNSKDFFNLSNELLGKDKNTITKLPKSIKSELLPDTFGDFFTEKIEKPRHTLVSDFNHDEDFDDALCPLLVL
ncbi:hypothetical protein ElyMa_005947700 [Elysia marginata]|uniref:Uncharacterized protein n=1 Tax=Elysia marginata TaxID=1093978 RepID=A0AAV4GBD7_9GAST|nr:hypothetical protein ElyMa_005947700 [Elysia marginata]